MTRTKLLVLLFFAIVAAAEDPGVATNTTAAEQSNSSSSINTTAGALATLGLDANSTAAAANVSIPAGTASDANTTIPAGANQTVSAPTNNTDSISNNSNINLNLTASDWHRGRHRPWDGNGGSGSGWQGDWQGNWQVDQSEDRWSDALPACPPGQGRPSPSEQCQLCPYGRFSPGLKGPCLRCPDGTVTINPGATECGCRPGTGTLTLNEGPCQPCPNGTYAPGGSLSPCIRCPGSAFMVTPPKATRVSQCTCRPGYGSTPDFPLSCQMCPIGTYANALAEIINIPGVPPQGGKGITGGLVGATIKPCTPCCPVRVGTCGLTTLRPGSTSYRNCTLVQPDTEVYCCGVANCTTKVPKPPNTLPRAALDAVKSATAKPDFASAFQGATVSYGTLYHGVNDKGVLLPPRIELNGARDTVTGGRRFGGSWGGSSGGSSWDRTGDSSGSSGGWNSASGGGSSSWGGGSSGSSWGGGSSGSSSWGGSSGTGSGGGGSGSSGSSNNWDDGAQSRSWDAMITSGAVEQDSLLMPAEVPPFANFGSIDGSSISNATNSSIVDSSSYEADSSSLGSISSTDQVSWWGASSLGPEPLGACTANPRQPESNSAGLPANTPWIVSYWADLTTGTTCPYNRNNLALLATGCTGSQIAPYLVLTAAHCVDPTLYRLAIPACANLVLVRVRACYSFNRSPNGGFNCTNNGMDAVGVSWFDRDNSSSGAAAVAPNDQGIVFLPTPRPAPFYQYNYIENFPTAFNSSTNQFQSLSYSGDGSINITNSDGTNSSACGCAVCSSMPCGLGRSGPAPGPLTTDARQPTNGAVNAKLEACGGSSGNCMTINGQQCCMAVDSYEYRAVGTDPCANVCANYWSTISKDRPIARLWATVRWTLPKI